MLQVEKLRQEKLRLAEELRQKKATLKAKGAQKPAPSIPANGPGPAASSVGVQVPLTSSLQHPQRGLASGMPNLVFMQVSK